MANGIKPITLTDILSTDTVVGNLMSDLRQIIDEARIHVASTANYELTMMYWHIGERINRDVLGNERAEYGKLIVATVSRQLGSGYYFISCKDVADETIHYENARQITKEDFLDADRRTNLAANDIPLAS